MGIQGRVRALEAKANSGFTIATVFRLNADKEQDRGPVTFADDDVMYVEVRWWPAELPGRSVCVRREDGEGYDALRERARDAAKREGCNPTVWLHPAVFGPGKSACA